MNSRHGPNGHQREYAWTGNRTGARRLRALGDAPPAPTAFPGPAGGRGSNLPRVAFYGRAGLRGVNGVHTLAHQFDVCCEAAADRAVVTRFFYDLLDPLDEITTLAVAGAGGPPRRDGGWDDLVAAVPARDGGFQTVVCSSLDRLLGNLPELGLPESLTAGVDVVSAEELADLLPPVAPTVLQLARQVVAAVRDYDRALADDTTRPPRTSGTARRRNRERGQDCDAGGDRRHPVPTAPRHEDCRGAHPRDAEDPDDRRDTDGTLVCHDRKPLYYCTEADDYFHVDDGARCFLIRQGHPQ